MTFEDNRRPRKTADRPELLLAQKRISRRGFIHMMTAAGMTAASASILADSTMAIAQTQEFNTANLRAEYDYIVCGAGSAGCVVAAQLAEDGSKSVLLLEAGGSDDVEKVLSPLWFQVFLDPDYFWVFNGEPEGHINHRKPLLPMGKVIGGGSSVNALVYSRGHKADYDGWAELLDDDRWSYDNVLSVFRRIEHFNGPADPRRGRGGPFWSELPSQVHVIAKALKVAGEAQGIPAVDDINAATQEHEAGIGHPNVIVKDGRRHSVARSFLYPVAAQPNITVLTGAMVTKVMVEGDKAVGVEFVRNGETHKIRASRQITLSMGALKTPQVLMLSGIGDETELTRFGIPTLQNLPGVGRNFHDHPLVAGCIWEYRNPLPPIGTVSQCVYFARVNSAEAAPDIMPVQIQIPFASEVHQQRPDVPEAGWTIVPGLAKPKSRGRMTLRSANMAHDPVTTTGFLSHPDDIETLRRGIELTRELGNSVEMREFVKREVMPGNLKGDALTAFIRDGVATYFHMSGTCKMGRDNDEMAVLDSNCAVRGIRNLSVADTSAFPDIPRGNTMAPAAMLGYQVAQHLLANT